MHSILTLRITQLFFLQQSVLADTFWNLISHLTLKSANFKLLKKNSITWEYLLVKLLRLMYKIKPLIIYKLSVACLFNNGHKKWIQFFFKKTGTLAFLARL